MRGLSVLSDSFSLIIYLPPFSIQRKDIDMKIIIAVVFVIFLCAVLGGIMDNKDKAKKVGVHLLKVVSLWVLISIVVLLCAAIQPSTIQAMAVMAIIACDVFGIPIYVAFCLVRNFTDGTLKKVMYAVWGVMAVLFVSVAAVIVATMGNNEAATNYIEQFGLNTFTAAVIAVPVILLLSLLAYFYKRRAKSFEGAVAVLKGLFVHGISEYKVSVILYQDRVVIRGYGEELASIRKAEIISVSADKNEVVVGTITKTKQQPSLGAAAAMSNRHWGSAYLISQSRPVISETKNKTEMRYCLILDTSTEQIVIQVKSKSALSNFVDKCNAMLCQPDQTPRATYSTDYDEDEYSAEEKEQIDIDSMSGTDFERFCADLLRLHGYTDVYLTPASGDQGIDITAEKDDMKWCFQCKCWGTETSVGNNEVMQTYAGKAFYHCDIAVVITTSYFTRKAKEYAQQTGVLLWDRDKLFRMMEKME